jgi:hypothetical protein
MFTSATRTALIDLFHATAIDHLRDCRDPRPDPRLMTSAIGLVELADHVRTLPDDDPRLLAMHAALNANGYFAPSDDIRWTVARFRYHNDRLGCDLFLNGLVAKLARPVTVAAD